MDDIKNFDSFLNEDLESDKNFVLANIKSGNDKLVREIFTWYVNICEEDELGMIATAFRNKAPIIK